MKTKRLLATLQGEKTDRPPFWFMRQAGRYLPEYREVRAQAGGFLELCFDPKKAAEVTLQPLLRFGMDAAILFADILLVPMGLGQEVRFEAGEGPKLEPVDTCAKIEALVYDAKKLGSIGETVKRVAADLPADVVLIGFAGSPWTVACYMVEGSGSRDFQKVREFAQTQRAAFDLLIDRLVEATTGYLRMQIDEGAEVIQLFDSWAGVLSEREFHAYCIAPTRRIVANLKKSHPHVPVIGFPRRAGALVLHYARETAIDAISLDDAQPLDFIAKLPLTVQGNLDPLLLKSDRDAALAEAEKLRGAMRGKNFIFNLGHGILQHTPVENVQALSDYLRSADA